MTAGKIKRWVVYKSPGDELKVCRADVYVDWLQRLQGETGEEKFTRSDEELGATLRRFPVISMHATHKEAKGMVKLTEE